MKHGFTITVEVPLSPEAIDDVVERLGDAGCQDALVGLGIPGRISLRFLREAESEPVAIARALEAVLTAVPMPERIEIQPVPTGMTAGSTDPVQRMLERVRHGVPPGGKQDLWYDNPEGSPGLGGSPGS